jgi:amino-acid N-acetyltransferase
MNQTHVVRAAGFRDSQAIFDLIKSYPDELLPRPISDIIQNIDRALVCELDGKVVGTVSWQIMPEVGTHRGADVEIKSLAVLPGLVRKGIGQALVNGAIQRILPLNPDSIIALTFAPGFFAKMGFVVVPKATMMHKIYSGCINCTKYDNPFTCPEIAVELKLQRS